MVSQVDSRRTSLGWIGTGVMGASMCARLLEAGFQITVHSRTPAKAAPLLERGARWAESPAEVARRAEVVFSMVGYPEDVRAVVLGDAGVLAGLRPGGVLVDMTTSQPSLAQEIARRAEAQGCWSLDAPVSGGDVGARSGRLSIMIGGDAAVVEALMPCFEALGQTLVHQGPAGSGQHAKLANQILVASGMIGVCEALLYGYRAGLDAQTLLRSVASGAAGSWTLSNLAPRILQGDFAPGFFVRHFVKDMGLALEEARRMRLALPGLALVEQLYVALMAQGHDDKGTQALMLALASLSGLDWPRRNGARAQQSQ